MKITTGDMKHKRALWSCFGNCDWWPIIVFFVAFGYRLFFIIQIRNAFLFTEPLLDAQFYHNFAMGLIKGETTSAVFFMNPGYPFFLYLLYNLLPPLSLTVAIVQSLLSAFMCALIYKICRGAFDYWAAIFSGILAAFYGPGVFYDSMRLSASLITVLNTVMLFYIYRFSMYRRRYDMFIAGLVFGFSVLCRPNIALFGVPLLAYLYVLQRSTKPRKEFLRTIAIFVCATFIVIFPVALRNYLVGGGLLLQSQVEG